VTNAAQKWMVSDMAECVILTDSYYIDLERNINVYIKDYGYKLINCWSCFASHYAVLVRDGE
jgi:hypothetical protein